MIQTKWQETIVQRKPVSLRFDGTSCERAYKSAFRLIQTTNINKVILVQRGEYLLSIILKQIEHARFFPSDIWCFLEMYRISTTFAHFSAECVTVHSLKIICWKILEKDLVVFLWVKVYIDGWFTHEILRFWLECWYNMQWMELFSSSNGWMDKNQDEIDSNGDPCLLVDKKKKQSKTVRIDIFYTILPF